MPVRSIPKNYLGVTGGFSSRKNGRMLGFESLLERDYMVCLEFDPDVVSFEEQPVRVPVKRDGGRSTKYVPDILVHYRPARNGKARKPRLEEVKRRSDLERNKEKYAPKFAAARRYSGEMKWDFGVVSEKDIRTPRLANLKFLREYHLIDPAADDITHVMASAVSVGGEIAVSELFERVAETDAVRLRLIPVVWHLVATGHLWADLARPITNETMLSVTTEGARK